ncbi:unnamed protein product [Rotaria magnacalcarata]|uniref:Uncharacterized protein n=1 Tax=Rotaria magnacalcarata TaxID=392030 RepID=A0A816YFV4_9BILA|nr:unnamed protein product [Rotaria magnacalcarata]CAF5171075.1 unnamed protein product [Rotaria magnacalcarata]
MSNLQELSLYFANHIAPIIDGNNLEENIFNHMTNLKKFEFNIRSIIPFNNQFNLSSNGDIQNAFKNPINNQIMSRIDYFPKANQVHSYIYSYPYTFTHFENITNNFRDELFKCVREISLFDERPFEHEFCFELLNPSHLSKNYVYIIGNRKRMRANNAQSYSILILLN